MKKFLDLSSWSRKAAIGSMLIMAFAVVGCDDSSSASAGQNDEPGVESSSSSSGKAGEPAEPAEEASSSSEKAKSSSSDTRSDANQSSSSEKTGKSSSSSKDIESSSSFESDGVSSSSVKSESSSSVKDSQSSSSNKTSESSSSSAVKVNCSALLEGETGWNWDVPKECRFNPDIDYGTMTDERDGKVYRTVKIGDQIWMAENLNFDPGQGGSGEDKYDWSWCYDNEPKNCDVAGRYYTWAAAIDSVKLANDAENPQECGYGKNCNLPAKVQGVCPPDWHLPTQAEWNTLFLSVGGQYQSTAGKALKSQSGWFVINSGNYFFNGNGTDEFGFCALPVGWEDREGFHDASHFAEFWSSTESTDRDWAYNACVKNYEDEAYVDLPTRKDVGTSVRCVKN